MLNSTLIAGVYLCAYLEANLCGHGNKLMYNFHNFRALELNTDIGYIPEKSNKTGNGIENFFAKISQLESHKPRRVLNLTWSTLTFAPPTFQKKSILLLIFLAITYPSIRRIFLIWNICSRMTERLKL